MSLNDLLNWVFSHAGSCWMDCEKINPIDFRDPLTFSLVPPCWHLWSRLKHLNNYLMDCHKICYRYSRCLGTNSNGFGDPLTFPLAPPAGDLSCETSQRGWMEWHKNSVQIFMIAVKFGSDIHVPRRVICNSFDCLTFYLVPSSGQIFILSNTLVPSQIPFPSLSAVLSVWC